MVRTDVYKYEEILKSWRHLEKPGRLTRVMIGHHAQVLFYMIFSIPLLSPPPWIWTRRSFNISKLDYVHMWIFSEYTLVSVFFCFWKCNVFRVPILLSMIYWLLSFGFGFAWVFGECGHTLQWSKDLKKSAYHTLTWKKILTLATVILFRIRR